jgi:hypothetical protein
MEEPPELILKFLSEQPTVVQTGLYSQIALSYCPSRAKTGSRGPHARSGKRPVLARNVTAHEEVMPQTIEALTDQFGSLEFQWHQTRKAHEKWVELRNGLLSPKQIESFSDRATAVSEPLPINVQGTTKT